MQSPFLLEIGVEELPAIPFLKELPNIKEKFKKILETQNIKADFELYFTPRRVVIYAESFPAKAEDITEEIFGPPVDVAIKDGVLTKAGEGFLRKTGASFEELGRAKKSGKEVLYFQKSIPGKELGALIETITSDFLSSLHFGKSMRWGSLSEEFIRPIRWFLAIFDGKPLPFSLYGIESTMSTFLHRNTSHEAQQIKSIPEYFEKLATGNVTLSQEGRREKILAEIAILEDANSIDVERDAALLDEIVAITEHPSALLGSFEERFLELPPEVIITSMKEHQRYFGVYKDGKLTNRFVVVSNSIAEDFSKVVSGNEKVLKARLSDALFFYRNDLKAGLDSEKLESVTFLKELGSMRDKRDREIKIALKIFDLYKEQLSKESALESSELRNMIELATKLSKADLMSEMVYEFTELQGLMGYYYAKAAGEHPLVAEAIKEQYLPLGESSPLPTNLFSSIVAIANKLDNLLGLFSIGMIPTGTKDPFALRRAALGILRIVIERKLDFKVDSILEMLKGEYREFDITTLEEFLSERIYALFKETNPSLIKSVFASGEKNIIKITEKIEALQKVLDAEDRDALFSTFKRVANITKDVDIEQELPINPELFESEYEQNLFKEFAYIDESSYEKIIDEIRALFSLKPTLDSFFDNVMVNSEDAKIRQNRKNLIASIYKAFRKFADLKEITI